MQFPPTEDISEFMYTCAAIDKMKGIVFAHLNVCSVSRKLDEIRILLEKSHLDFLFLTETFLNESINDAELAIPGYHFIRSHRRNREDKKRGGGVLLYYGEDYVIHNCVMTCSNLLESIWVTVSLPKARPIELCGFHRPPGASYDLSIDEMHSQLSTRNISPAVDLLLLGDCNIDFMSRSNAKTKLSNFLKLSNLDQSIKCPTRITTRTATCIDHVYSNNIDLFANAGTLQTGLSDHDLIFVCRKKCKIRKAKVSICIRCYRHFDSDLFSHDIRSTDWTDVTLATDINIASIAFDRIFTGLLDKHLPWKRICVRAPWISNEFLSLIDARQYHTRQFNLCPCQAHFEARRQSHILVQQMKNKLKRDYI